MQEGDATVKPSEFASQGNEKTVIKCDCGEHGDIGEDSHGASRDLEGFCDVPIHGFGL